MKYSCSSRTQGRAKCCTLRSAVHFAPLACVESRKRNSHSSSQYLTEGRREAEEGGGPCWVGPAGLEGNPDYYLYLQQLQYWDLTLARASAAVVRPQQQANTPHQQGGDEDDEDGADAAACGGLLHVVRQRRMWNGAGGGPRRRCAGLVTLFGPRSAILVAGMNSPFLNDMIWYIVSYHEWYFVHKQGERSRSQQQQQQ